METIVAHTEEHDMSHADIIKCLEDVQTEVICHCCF
jgi:hypothetical protein